MSHLASMKLGDGGFAREEFLDDCDVFLSIDRLSGLVLTDGISAKWPSRYRWHRGIPAGRHVPVHDRHLHVHQDDIKRPAFNAVEAAIRPSPGVFDSHSLPEQAGSGERRAMGS